MSLRSVLLAVASAAMLGGCAVVAVADAAVTVVATTVKVGAKVVGAGVDAVIPDDDDDEDAKKE
ncbi:NF038104 family lipoprotein [Aromatoleum tolulyticum]|nr:NF038104 family lipoprotein [Aromatoleum tolulyticum]